MSKKYNHAEAYDAKLAGLQRKALSWGTEERPRAAVPYENYSARRYDAPRRTTVMGLQISIAMEQRTGIITRYYPEIVIAARAPDGRRLHTSRFITPSTRTLPEAWREACRLLATFHGHRRTPSRWLKAQPTVQDFRALAKHYRQRGISVPHDLFDAMRTEEAEHV